MRHHHPQPITFGAFTSGIGTHYSRSMIVHTAHQTHALALVIGPRTIPHIFVRTADVWLFEIQVLLPADTPFKLLVFAGDTTDAAQLMRVCTLAAALEGDVYCRFSGVAVFDVLAMCAATKEQVNYTNLPAIYLLTRKIGRAHV